MSGMVGIGGGILLSPVLLLQPLVDHQGDRCAIGAVHFVNSLAGLERIIPP